MILAVLAVVLNFRHHWHECCWFGLLQRFCMLALVGWMEHQPLETHPRHVCHGLHPLRTMAQTMVQDHGFARVGTMLRKLEKAVPSKTPSPPT